MNFIQRLLTRYHNVKIALTEGGTVNGNNDPVRPQKTVLQQYLNDADQKINSFQVQIIPSEYYPGDTCDSHPTKE